MDPRKSNARRGFKERDLKRKQSRERVASEWQPEIFPEEENTMSQENISRKKFPWWIILIILGVLALCSCCCVFTIGGFLFPQSASAVIEPTEAPIAATEAPIVATEAPIVATEAPIVATEALAPIAIICDMPYIKASLDGSMWTEQGEYLDTILGKRMTFTNRKVVVPSKAWNDPLTADELKLVEQTWVHIQICVVEGQNAVIFTSGFEQSVNRYENGALLSLKPGEYQFRIRNGEIVIWYPGQETFASKDLERIFDQIRNGNFDIKGELAFFGVTTDLLPKIPQDLVKQRNVQIVPSLDPITK